MENVYNVEASAIEAKKTIAKSKTKKQPIAAIGEKKEAKRPAIDPGVRLKLWVRAGGRCQYRGCNDRLDIDKIKQKDLNTSYMAHIYGFAEKSARFHKVLSPLLAKDFTNLMLVCDACHRRIDVEEKDLHSPEMLLEMKREHEDRIMNLTSIRQEVKTNVLIYSARIGTFMPDTTLESVRMVLADRNLYPTNDAIEIGIKHSSVEDDDVLFWQTEEKSLVDGFDRYVKRHFENVGINHFSLFALAPQPLLIKLGTLISDLYAIDVYQKHREPKTTWAWQENKPDFAGFKVHEPENLKGIPVLKISLSGSIDSDRITPALAGDLSIWNITIEAPNTGFLTHPDILQEFRKKMRFLFDRIKEVHGHDKVLRVFPAMPSSAAVEFGRVWMPKADMSMEIYDERNGFKKAITITRN